MERIYLAGKISGLDENAYRTKFNRYANKLRGEGYFVINPVDTSHFNLNYDIQMEVCLALLKSCDSIFLLKDWENSKGANIEKEYAEKHGIKIIYES